MSFFEGSKVLVAEGVICVLLILYIFKYKNVGHIELKKSAFFFLIGIILLSLGHILINTTQTELFGNPYRMQGTILLWFLILFSIFSSSTKVEKKYLQIFVFLVLLMQCIFSILFIGVGTDRPVGSIGEPNALAAVSLFMWPFIVFRTSDKTYKQKWFSIISLFVIGFIIIISGSRSGLIAFSIQIGLLIAYYFYPKKLIYITIAGILIMLISFATPFISEGSVYENRGEIWLSALNAGAMNPILGTGFGNIEYRMHESNVILHNHLPGYYVDSSHNVFLDWWIQGGIIGLLFFIGLLFTAFSTFIKQSKIRELILLIGVITALSFNPASVVSLIALWWLIGQSIHN